jgi:hypothetical protein
MILNIWFHWDFGEIYWFCPNKNPVISLVAQIPLRPRWPARCCCLFLTIQWSWQLGWPQGRPGQACRSNIVYEGWNRYETVVFWGNHWIYMGIYMCIIYIYDYIWIYRPSEAFWGILRHRQSRIVSGHVETQLFWSFGSFSWRNSPGQIQVVSGRPREWKEKCTQLYCCFSATNTNSLHLYVCSCCCIYDSQRLSRSLSPYDLKRLQLDSEFMDQWWSKTQSDPNISLSAKLPGKREGEVGLGWRKLLPGESNAFPLGDKCLCRTTLQGTIWAPKIMKIMEMMPLHLTKLCNMPKKYVRRIYSYALWGNCLSDMLIIQENLPPIPYEKQPRTPLILDLPDSSQVQVPLSDPGSLMTIFTSSKIHCLRRPRSCILFIFTALADLWEIYMDGGLA